MQRTFELKAYRKKYKIGLEIGRYGNGSLAIRGIDYSEGYPQPFSNITVNLDVELEDSFCAFLNVESNPELPDLLIKEGLGEFTGRGCQTCTILFPEFRFNKDALKSFDEDGFEEYLAYSEALQLLLN